jgi:hypothetical protein
MLQALAVLARDGSVPQLGDDDGGRLFDASRNRKQSLLDPLATGAVLFGRGDFKSIAGGPREETLWLLGEAGLEEFNRLPAVAPKRNSIAFQASGLYMMSGDSGRQLVIDAGPQGAHTAGHGHADALSLTASSGGVDLLIDSGTFEYVGADDQRDRFRGTRAHNTLSVAGQDQAEPKGPFSWGRLPKVEAEGWIVGQTFDLFAGSHDGYSRLPNAVVHRRFVFALKSGFWLVRDQALGFGEYPLDLYWHLGPGLKPASGQGHMFLGNGHGLRFVAVDGNGWTESVEDQPHSPAYGKKENHCVVHFTTSAQLPAEFVTLMVPASGVSHDVSRSEHRLARIVAPSSVSAVGYSYKTNRDEHHIIFGGGKPWKLDHWSSDAEFLYWGQIGDSPAQTLVCCNATYVQWSERPVVTARRTVLRCEIIGSEKQFEVISSDPESVAVDREGWRMLLERSILQPAGKFTAEEKS